MNMVEKRTWEEFRNIKLLWWINRTLHLFGWAIVYQVESDGTISDVYPARVKFRGFEDESEEFIGLTKYIQSEIDNLVDETKL